MNLHTQTRLVITGNYDLFFRAVNLIHGRLMAVTVECHPNANAEYLTRLRKQVDNDMVFLNDLLAFMANEADPSLKVHSQKIVHPHVYLMPDKANLLFEYMSEEGMQAVSIRLDPELYRTI